MAVFEAGTSGNPNGRPTNKAIALRNTPNAKLRLLLKQLERNLPDAVGKMVELMNDDKTPPTVQMQAAKTIIAEYKEIYQLLEAPAKEKVDNEVNEDAPSAPVVDFLSIVPTAS
jgi:hypothetical protein